MIKDNPGFLGHLERHKYPYVILAVIILANLTVFRDLIADWIRDGNYSHGFLVIPISAWLFYRRRKELVFPAVPGRWGMVLFVLGCLGMIFGYAASEYFSLRFSLVLAVTGLALYHLGSRNFKRVWFSFFFLLFMIPIPAIIYYSVTLPMQLLASKITNGFLHVIGVPSHRLGNIIYLPAYTLEVSEACSGLRSLATLMALAALIGYMSLDGRVRPLILFLLAIPVAVAANIFRLVFTAVGAYAVSAKLAEDFLHEISGILVFIFALIVMMVFAGILRWKRNPS